MRTSQALDLGLCLAAVILIMLWVLLSAQASIMSSDDGGTVPVRVTFDAAGGYRLSGPHFRGTLRETRAVLTAACAVQVPPQIELDFPEDTLLTRAHAVYRDLHGLPDLVCPISY